jgi:hypothetical protein
MRIVQSFRIWIVILLLELLAYRDFSRANLIYAPNIVLIKYGLLFSENSIDNQPITCSV